MISSSLLQHFFNFLGGSFELLFLFNDEQLKE
jgi:hypothetical protein